MFTPIETAPSQCWWPPLLYQRVAGDRRLRVMVLIMTMVYMSVVGKKLIPDRETPPNRSPLLRQRGGQIEGNTANTASCVLAEGNH